MHPDWMIMARALSLWGIQVRVKAPNWRCGIVNPGVIAMNDDRIAVRANNGGSKSYGLPWAGSSEIARNHAARLSAIIVLEQAPENVIERLPPSAAVSLLAARAFLPYWDRDLMRLAITNLNTILTNVPVYHLRCRPEPAAIALVRSVL